MFNRSCREVTRLVLEGEDRSLSIGERFIVRWHYRACTACPRFGRQVQFMRVALARWRNYRDAE
jgi:hypothetical protein